MPSNETSTAAREDEIHNIVYKKLQEKMKLDTNFQNEISDLIFFYSRKLMGFTKTKEQKSLVEKDFEDVVFSQFFQGYYAMTILLNDEESFDEDDWIRAPGLVRNELPKFLKLITEDESINWTHTEIGHNFSIDILQSMESAYEVTKQLLYDLSNHGAFKAFTDDERYVGESTVPDSEMLLGNPFDLSFLSPQVYMQGQFYTTQHEVWDLFLWSAVRDDAWVGSVHLSTMPIENQTIYLLEFSVSSLISHNEKMDIINTIIKKIPENIRAILQTRLYNVDELDILVSTNQG